MHERKEQMADLADGFIAMPGGYGTLEEITEMLTWNQLGLQAKPVVFLEVEAFWAPMEAFLDHSVRAAVLRPEVRALFRTASSASAALDILAAW